jgi:hypothetical protein
MIVTRSFNPPSKAKSAKSPSKIIISAREDGLRPKAVHKLTENAVLVWSERKPCELHPRVSSRASVTGRRGVHSLRVSNRKPTCSNQAHTSWGEGNCGCVVFLLVEGRSGGPHFRTRLGEHGELIQEVSLGAN